jgi:hypothetical protein
MLFSDEGHRMKRVICGVFGIWAVVVCTSLAAPKPAIVPAPGQWTVDTEFTYPQQLVLRRSSDNEPFRFWYMIITLTNNTGNDVDFYPQCDLMTDTFQIVPAGQSVPTTVFEQIRKRYKSRYPFLESLDKAGNRILQGQDNTKDIAIIWPDFDIRATNIKLFISGLSNETAVVEDPVLRDKTGQPVKVYLRKTLEIDYALRGDPALRSSINLDYTAKRWVMR